MEETAFSGEKQLGEKKIPENKEGQEWYQREAGQGDADAQCTLGLKYENGQGVRKDIAKAAVWYRKAVKQGNADARKRLDIIMPCL